MRFLLLLWLLLSSASASLAAGPNLDESLRVAPPPAHGVALSVSAASVALPAGTVLPGTKLTVADAASLYGRASLEFGRVTALAPPTMVVLNTAPGEPNIYAGMPPLDAFTLLLASLSDVQWAALTSGSGLGVSDLTPAQQPVFAALLSHDGKLLVRPQYAEGEKYDDNDKKDLTEVLPQVHLRLGQAITLNLPPKEDPNSSYGDVVIPPPAGAPRQYEVADREDYGGSAPKDYGADVRADVPNVPKHGQLDFSTPTLKRVVPLSGLQTVGDLVYRIGGMTHVELYADPRLEKKPLTFLGETSAPAADLLRALAFCLCGTFRQVGPAYVLTDDIVGIGTRRQIWTEFEEDANSLRSGPVTAASNALYSRHHPRELSWFGDPGAYTPAEMKFVDPQVRKNDAYLPTLKLLFSNLTPAQQDMAERGLAKWNREYKMQPVTTDGMITVRPGLSTQLLVPGIATPVDLNLNHGGMDQIFVFQMSQEEVKEKLKADNDEEQKKYLAAHPELAAEMTRTPTKSPEATVFALLKPTPRRGAIIHPRTAKDVDADAAAAKTLGLNTLWLDVFSNGIAHLPGSALSGNEAAKTGDHDILAEALAQTKGTGITVCPLFDLLFWGQTPPTSDADLNILGETSAQAAARWQQRKALLPEGQLMSEEMMSNAVTPDWSGVAVSPLAPDVQTALVGYMKTIAARPGVAGLVWRDTDTPGYDLLPGGSDTSSLLLGYQTDMRLAFLRRFHADPIDIYDVGHSATLANTDLPNFTDQGHGNLMYTLHDDWVKFRQDRGLTFLQSLYVAINPPNTLAAKRVRILVKQRRSGPSLSDRPGHFFHTPGWYGSWDNPRLPPPTLHSMGEDYQPGQPSQPVPDETVQAKSQSQIVLIPFTSDGLDQLQGFLGMSQATGQKPHLPEAVMPGFVLDLDKTPSGEDPLPVLAAEVIAGAIAEAK